jgi:uncharacterized pyridoxal phosphate-dependent enzyme
MSTGDDQRGRQPPRQPARQGAVQDMAQDMAQPVRPDSTAVLRGLGSRLGAVINAAGTFTPVGVSRSSPAVAAAAAWALQHYLPIEALQREVDRQLADFSGLEAGTVVHCTSAAVVLAVAAMMTGPDPDRVARLPDATGMKRRVLLPGPHRVNYGHPIETDIRLPGAEPWIIGDRDHCAWEALDAALAEPEVAGLLLVRSHLTTDPDFDHARACAMARARGVPVVLDAAAQDFNIRRLAAWAPTAILCSAQKYLTAPTAGLVVGTRPFVEAVRLQDKGIGRPMKASKEALVGVLAALQERAGLDVPAYQAEQLRKAESMRQRLSGLSGITASVRPDPQGLPLSRVRVDFDGGAAIARAVTAAMKAGDPAVWVMEHGLAEGFCQLELVSLTEAELDGLAAAFLGALGRPLGRG